MSYLKPCKLDFKKFEVTETNKYIELEGPVSSYGNMDTYGDIMDQGCFSKSIKSNSTVKLVLDHNSNSTRDILGMITLYEKGDIIYGEGVMNKDYPVVRDEVIPRILDKSVEDFSIRIGSDAKIEKLKNVPNGRYLFKEATIKDVSLVPFGANPTAKIKDYSKSDEEIKEFLKELESVVTVRELEGALVKHGFSKEEAMLIISKSALVKRDAIITPYLKKINDLEIINKVQQITNQRT